MPLFAFTVSGPPVSLQARRKPRLQQWKQSVASAAREVWPEGQAVFEQNLKISIKYFYDDASPRIDTDNMIKPIQDALIGLVYKDDSQIVHSEATKIDIDGKYMVRGMPLVLTRAFSAGNEFLYIVIDHAPEITSLK